MRILGLNITRARERKESPVWRSMLTYLGGTDAVYTPTDYGTLTKAGYQMCAPAYAAVSLIARSAAGISWVVLKKKRDGSYDEVEEHPLLDLLAMPNENEDGYRLVESIVSYKLLAGNSYVLKVQGTKSAPPRYLYTLRPDRMKVVPGDAKMLVGGYRYTLNGIRTDFAPGEVLHLRDFNPLHDFYGLSRLEVAAKSIDISNWSEEWNLKSLQNDMRLSGLLKLDGLPKDAAAEIRRQLTDRYSGAGNAGKTLVLENAGAAEFTPMSMTPKDADWSESDKRNLRRICSIFNIWSGLLGDHENQTYANMSEGRKALYQEAVLPEMDGLKSALNRWLVPLFGDDLYLDYDRDHIEALQEDRGAKYTYLGTADWLTVNEKREACGYDEIPEGDVVLVGMGDMALAEAVAPAGELSRMSATDAGRAVKSTLGGFWRGENERKALWQNFERRVVAKERAFARDVAAYLKSQAEEVVARARNSETAPERLLDKDEAVESYVERFLPRYRKLYATARAAGRRLVEGKLYEFDEADDDKADGGWVDEATRVKLERLIAETATVITDETLAEIQAVMRDSLGTNLTVQEIADALRVKLVDTMTPVRARRIARTETGMLENAGNLDGFRENEFVNRKMWVCSFVPDSRDSHQEADGQEVDINDPFRVGAYLLDYPMDRSHGAGAGEVVNCLCAIAPVVGD